MRLIIRIRVIRPPTRSHRPINRRTRYSSSLSRRGGLERVSSTTSSTAAGARSGLFGFGALLFAFLGEEDLVLEVALGGPLFSGGVEGDAAEFGDGGVGVGFEFEEVVAAEGAVLGGVVVFDFGSGL